ncbi:short chain dehydrogenase [Paenibacillus sp. 1_12]|nr:short chain dehydrogenase [Paenibacillus sp. 1_12]
MNLKNQRVVIIGGSSGIGLATAKEAILQGARVVIAGRSLEKLESAKAALDSELLEIQQLDNKNEDSIKAFFTMLDILIICLRLVPHTCLVQ